MLELRETETFARWLRGLRDRGARLRIAGRLRLLAMGHGGDAKPVGEGVSELRIHHGPGYRVYFARRGDALVLILAGGDKASQRRDIERAKELAREWRRQWH